MKDLRSTKQETSLTSAKADMSNILQKIFHLIHLSLIGLLALTGAVMKKTRCLHASMDWHLNQKKNWMNMLKCKRKQKNEIIESLEKSLDSLFFLMLSAKDFLYGQRKVRLFAANS